MLVGWFLGSFFFLILVVWLVSRVLCMFFLFFVLLHWEGGFVSVLEFFLSDLDLMFCSFRWG